MAIRDELKQELIDIISSGEGGINTKLNRWRSKTMRRRLPDISIQDIKDLIEEVKEEEGADAKEETRFKREFISDVQKSVKFEGGKFKLADLSDPDLNINDITPSASSVKNWATSSAKLIRFASKPRLSSQEKEHIEEIIEHLDDLIARNAPKEELDKIELAPQELINGIININLTGERDKMYEYWEKISKKYTEVKSAVKALKKIPDSSKLPDNIEELINKLELPPEYIEKVPAKEVEFLKLGSRMGDWVSFVYAALTKELGVSAENLEQRRKSRDYENLTDAAKLRRGASETKVISRTKEMGIPGREKWGLSEKYGGTITETQREPLHTLTEGDRRKELSSFEYVDPIYYSLLEDKLNFPIRTYEIDAANKTFNAWIEMVKSRKLTSMERDLKRKLAKIKKEAFETTGNDEFYIPLTSWIADNYKQYTQTISTLNDKTSIFFETLSDILLKVSGQEQVHMETTHPKAGYDNPAAAKSKIPLFTGPLGVKQTKPTQIGLKRPRYQPGVDPKVREFEDEDISDKITVLLDALDEYYFIPIMGKSHLFINEIPPSFSSESSGTHFFNVLGTTFSQHPPLVKRKEMSATLNANMNYQDLIQIEAHLKNESVAEKDDDKANYIKILEETIESFTNLFGDIEWAQQYASDQLNRYLRARDEEEDLHLYPWKDGSKAEIRYKEWKKDGPAGSIALALRTHLMDSRTKEFIAERERMGINVTNLQRAVDSIIDLTSLEKLNNIPDINKSLLNAHDAIRRMKGKKVVYATLSINDFDSMDYIITKMESKYRVDVNATDIIKIVYSQNSFKALATNHGLSEEVIYEIKGLCR